MELVSRKRILLYRTVTLPQQFYIRKPARSLYLITQSCALYHSQYPLAWVFLPFVHVVKF